MSCGILAKIRTLHVQSSKTLWLVCDRISMYSGNEFLVSISTPISSSLLNGWHSDYNDDDDDDDMITG